MNADRRSRAHTLLEVLIAMVVGLLVLAAAGALYHAQRVAHGRAEDAFAMRDAATTALMLIGQQIQMAGFRSLDDDDALPLPPLFGCSAARVRGDGAQVRCEAAREASDAVVVRYVGDGVSTWPTIGDQVSDCLGQGIGAPGERPLVENHFDAHVSPSTGEPELYCEGSGRPGTPQPVVSGIDQLRVRYLRRGTVRFADAAAIGADGWRDIVAVHLCVRARGEPMRAPTRHVDCDGRVAVSDDGRARLTLHRIVALRNSSIALADRVVGGVRDGEAFR
ncbi:MULTISPECIES: type IV pillus assembly protein [Burkholderia]|uniref:Type IV pillus assembly protein n=1 Tax=Burkholderia vietnamiensis TaxID=60552 RepID=A0ABS1APX2_BURVI|nr:MULTISPECIES: type IV pillus assembly protein [Burkholderia]AFJ85061.1 Type IV fimbrial biogenesis protein PilW [Burkholderia sp. KJ006]AOK09372.1 N-terminal cleavage protein [Burkholderia vietnamiensis]AOK40171.1 N-terminal cleavage protein [Burkholderia vietnamiensis]KVE61982.1 N-terminal cleavage protein [Burkholderia vietnamiensis]KVF32591.1 N-terminal cleavage protein [Burkholderia vietnamiensis]